MINIGKKSELSMEGNMTWLLAMFCFAHQRSTGKYKLQKIISFSLGLWLFVDLWSAV